MGDNIFDGRVFVEGNWELHEKGVSAEVMLSERATRNVMQLCALNPETSVWFEGVLSIQESASLYIISEESRQKVPLDSIEQIRFQRFFINDFAIKNSGKSVRQVLSETHPKVSAFAKDAMER